MTVFKIKNPSHSKHPIHTVDGVRHIGARLTREFDLSGPGEKLVRASEVLPAHRAREPEGSEIHTAGRRRRNR